MKKVMKRQFLLYILMLCSLCVMAQSRWEIAGHHAVRWIVPNGGLPHKDHIEMSGEQLSVIYSWNVSEKGKFGVIRDVIFPMLRTLPEYTHAHWSARVDTDFLKELTINGDRIMEEQVDTVILDGMMTVKSKIKADYKWFQLTRCLFPSTTKAAAIESYSITNLNDKPATVYMPAIHNTLKTRTDIGSRGAYILVSSTDNEEGVQISLEAGKSITFYSCIQAYACQDQVEQRIDYAAESQARRAFVDEVTSKLDFQCPNDTLNTLFAMSKIRGSESIYRTRSGLMHGPGGGAYYAAIWANDQAEYITPFFPFLGYAKGNESGLVCWKLFKQHINPEYKYIPWSIISEGFGVFNPYDRGDAAMIAYGASRYCLEMGNAEITNEVWPLIEWCLEYCKRMLNNEGVVASDGDELEHRLPSGKANLCTSSLYYDALVSASYLARQMGQPKAMSKDFQQRAVTLRKCIDAYFHGEVEGYDTYHYYKGNDTLRSWICIPLTMGITERAQGTVKAMFSPQLWTENGMLSISHDKIFWDRTTLYGLRGAFASGNADQALSFMGKFSTKRLLDEHVPYVVEAWPEGGQRHLSAESGLYCRIVTEGLLGFRPTGYRSFTLTPQMPTAWDAYSLNGIHACTESPFDVSVTRVGRNLKVVLSREGNKLKSFTTKPGKTIQVMW